MRTLRSLVLSTICFIPSIGVAFDVGYQLNDKPLAALEEPKAADPVAIAITDRVWAAPGIEQAFSDLAPAREFDFAAPMRFRIVHVGESEGPQWLDDVAWPRTRELYGLGQSRAHNEQHEFWSGVTHQR
jgi:hypothetical protein